MMERPTVKREVSVHSIPDVPHWLKIETFSDDAWEWMRKEAPLFGEFREDFTVNYFQEAGLCRVVAGKRSMELIIERCFDPHEVCEYLDAGYTHQDEDNS